MAVASATPLFFHPFPSSSNQPHRRHRLPHAFTLRPSSISTPNFPPQLPFSLNSSLILRRRRFAAEASVGDSDSGGSTSTSDDGGLVGEDAAAFNLSEQKLALWAYFTVILGVVLFGLNFVWIDNSAGGVGKAFVDTVSSLSDSHEMVGQVIWCLAHTVWIGNSVAVAASIGLIGHHLFGVWNGDRRLSKAIWGRF